MVEDVTAAWAGLGIQSWRVGCFDASASSSTIRRDGKTRELSEPGVDPFWSLFFAGLSESE
jgi:hypothetical protein